MVDAPSCSHKRSHCLVQNRPTRHPPLFCRSNMKENEDVQAYNFLDNFKLSLGSQKKSFLDATGGLEEEKRLFWLEFFALFLPQMLKLTQTFFGVAQKRQSKKWDGGASD